MKTGVTKQFRLKATSSHDQDQIKNFALPCYLTLIVTSSTAPRRINVQEPKRRIDIPELLRLPLGKGKEKEGGMVQMACEAINLGNGDRGYVQKTGASINSHCLPPLLDECRP